MCLEVYASAKITILSDFLRKKSDKINSNLDFFFSEHLTISVCSNRLYQFHRLFPPFDGEEAGQEDQAAEGQLDAHGDPDSG